VAGESQVIVLKHPEQVQITSKGLIKLKDLQFSIYTAGMSLSSVNDVLSENLLESGL
jgi:hypothetical protein